jgi:hypothetical protein
MSDHAPYPRKIGGKFAHVGDCYVWAEIYYLDSLTDYREFLPVVSASQVSDQEYGEFGRWTPTKNLQIGGERGRLEVR